MKEVISNMNQGDDLKQTIKGWRAGTIKKVHSARATSANNDRTKIQEKDMKTKRSFWFLKYKGRQQNNNLREYYLSCTNRKLEQLGEDNNKRAEIWLSFTNRRCNN